MSERPVAMGLHVTMHHAANHWLEAVSRKDVKLGLIFFLERVVAGRFSNNPPRELVAGVYTQRNTFQSTLESWPDFWWLSSLSRMK